MVRKNILSKNGWKFSIWKERHEILGWKCISSSYLVWKIILYLKFKCKALKGKALHNEINEEATEYKWQFSICMHWKIYFFKSWDNDKICKIKDQQGHKQCKI